MRQAESAQNVAGGPHVREKGCTAALQRTRADSGTGSSIDTKGGRALPPVLDVLCGCWEDRAVSSQRSAGPSDQTRDYQLARAGLPATVGRPPVDFQLLAKPRDCSRRGAVTRRERAWPGCLLRSLRLCERRRSGSSPRRRGERENATPSGSPSTSSGRAPRQARDIPLGVRVWRARERASALLVSENCGRGACPCRDAGTAGTGGPAASGTRRTGLEMRTRVLAERAPEWILGPAALRHAQDKPLGKGESRTVRRGGPYRSDTENRRVQPPPTPPRQARDMPLGKGERQNGPPGRTLPLLARGRVRPPPTPPW